ncbi:DeoR/GlpR family DNA-binding transcription regulator [Aquibacillus albus]|uniref:DeoR/GlpR family transcriptional regulator of sugar metabolism n=1 Tax=Aquibacillus albus TaxID=1168171 RepID=A0ABS2MZT4_9BACI|nr:DeoR/GlpR family DNA-binding transcription regulator [Aquibacillus albus]MBM7571351.1 DeoR/GlpR family transcriptional regulator of sugar metabolism [Aquibacillus albus]
MKATRRRSEILRLIDQHGTVAVDDLIQRYQVSEETIRRDLRILDESGYVKRVYGGAVKLEKTTRYLPYEDRLTIQYKEKEAIGKESAQLLEDGDSVFVDGRTTCLVFANHIPAELNITIVTNSIFIAHNLMGKKGNLNIHLVGGALHPDGILTGPKLIQELQGYRFDKAFFSCIGVNSKGSYFAKADAQQLALTLKELSTELILLADSSKIDRLAFLSGLKIEQFSYIITDEFAPVHFVDQVRRTTCKIQLATVDQQHAMETQHLIRLVNNVD